MDQKKTVRPFSMKDKIGYTLGDLGCCFTEQYRAMYLSIFYTLILQVNPFHVGILLLITKIWDAVNDPIWEAERKGRDRADKPEYKVKLSVALCFSNKTALCEYYHNSSFLEHGGSPEKATRSAMVSAIDKYLRDNNKYAKGEAKITFPDVQDCLILVSSSFSTQTSYENQTKKAITNKFIQEAMTEFLRSRMEIFFIENREAAEKIAAQVLINKRSRETAERTRINQKKKLTEKIDIANRVQKFVDCRTKDVERREIYIVEGDSALGACKQSRDAEFQGLMPVRGKILNCLKADYPRIFKSDVITDLMKVLGCGVEVSGKAVKELNQFDLNNLRWSKVVICTDGDVDGFQIRTLILTMLYRLCPTLIREGYVYIAETPLFEITCKEKSGEKTWFAYSEKEKADILKKLEGKKVNVQRSKVITASLIEGKVRVDCNDTISYVLTPGYQVVYNKCTDDCQMLTANMKDVTAWMRGELVFDKVTLTEIVRTLERHYGITFHISTKKSNQDRYNFVFRKDATLEETLEVKYSF